MLTFRQISFLDTQYITTLLFRKFLSDGLIDFILSFYFRQVLKKQ